MIVRTGAGTAFLLKPVLCAYYRSEHSRKELLRITGSGGSLAGQKELQNRFYADSVFALAAGRALPGLEEDVRRTVLACFGQEGKSGISLGGVWRWLEEALPAQERRRLAVPDWQAIAGRIAVKAMAADPGFVQAYEKLRSLTGRYPEDPDCCLLFSSADNRACRLPPFVPRGAMERLAYFNAEMDECWRLQAQCMAGRQPLVNWLHGEVMGEAAAIAASATPLFDEAFRSGSLWIREFLAWFMPEGDADIDGMMAEFERRYSASGRSFDVFQIYYAYVALMLRDWDALEWPSTDFFRLRAKNALKRFEALRALPEGAW